jgi:hypothetical protein
MRTVLIFFDRNLLFEVALAASKCPLLQAVGLDEEKYGVP